MDSSLFSPLLAGIALVPSALLGIAWWRQRTRARDAERRLADTAAPSSGREPEGLRARELEALGRLSGHVAHDFNNVLTVVSANTEILLMELRMPGAGLDPERLESSLAQVQTAARRGVTLTRRLLTFGRSNAPLPRAGLDVAQAIRDLEEPLAARLPDGVELRVLCQDDAGQVRAEAHRLEELLSILIENAADSLPDGGAVTLGLRARPDSREIEMSVSDEGEGMSEQTQARLFEPYFTTRTTGEHRGFGLAMAHGIVQRLDGRFEVESERRRGSTFRVVLPRAEAPRD
jgi:signal transduction histidine kinase